MDVYDFCSDRIQAALKVYRDRAADEILAGGDSVITELMTVIISVILLVTQASKDMEPAASSDDLQAALALSLGGFDPPPIPPEEGSAGDSIGVGIPADFKGMYELFAVVTHKGRSANGGHYIGWLRIDGDNWMCFDDEIVSPCKTEDVKKLKGGGDYDMAYLAFYRCKE